MKNRSLIVVAACLLAILPLSAQAATTGWEMTAVKINDGNKFMAGWGIDDKNVFAISAEKDSSGNSTLAFARSTDGGHTYTQMTAPSVSGAMMSIPGALRMITKDIGLAAGMAIAGISATAQIWKTTDGGNSFTAATLPRNAAGKLPTTCYSLFCYDAATCWASCDSGTVYRSSNAGDTWLASNLPNGGDLTVGATFFLDPVNGFAAAYQTQTSSDGNTTTILPKGTIYKTSNAGISWTAVSTGLAYTFNGLQAIDANTLYLLGADTNLPYIWKSTDGGTTWNNLPITQSRPAGSTNVSLYNLGGMAFLDANTGWLAASYGTADGGMGNKLFFLKTTDGGASWVDFQATYKDTNGATQTAPGTVYAMNFVNEHLGYAFGDYEMSLVFNDGSYVPPVDGDTDADGDGGSTADGDADSDSDSTPVYSGAPGDPCPIPGKADTYDFPRCDAAKGSPLCFWKDGVASQCTATCTRDIDCYKLDPNAKCKPVNYDGTADTRICFLDAANNPSFDYSGSWYGYTGSLLGEGCFSVNHPASARCDAYEPFAGNLCIDDTKADVSYCSRKCTKDSDCTGGLLGADDSCCNGTSGDVTFCRYGTFCHPEPVVDGDSDATSETPDGDTTGEETADGDHEGSGANGGGGCHQGTAPAAWLALALLGLAWRRRLA